MEKELLDLVFELKESLKNEENVVLLNKAEQLMNDSEEVVKLAIEKEKAVDEYNFALSHFDKNSDEVINAQKKLYQAKKELDLHPLVIDYMNKYKNVRNMYDTINEILFSIINKDKCSGGCSK